MVRLTRYVRIPYRGPVPLTRRAVFARDGGRCVYCGVPATSIDHVVPRSRGGRHEWDNVVSACRRCNHVKADRTVADLGWRLHPPQEPTGTRLADPRHRPLGPAAGRPTSRPTAASVRARLGLGRCRLTGSGPAAVRQTPRSMTGTLAAGR